MRGLWRDNWKSLGVWVLFFAWLFSVGFALNEGAAAYKRRNDMPEETQVADRQAALSAGRVVLKLSSADPGTVTLDKVAIHVEEMERLLGFRQGQLVICFHNGVGEQIAEIHSEQWTLTIKPKAVRMSFELRIRPEAETLLMLREIQQNIEGEDDEGATVVLRPLQSAELMEDEEE